MARLEAKLRPSFDTSVFINGPFDQEYKAIFNAIVFTVYDSGFYPMCAYELSDASESRLKGIVRIRECRYGIHDISRTQLDAINELPRFNMPLELGMFLGCKEFGAGQDQLRACLIMDIDPHRYQKFMSDIAGQDVLPHGGDPRASVLRVRDWLRAKSQRIDIPDGGVIWSRFSEFQDRLPAICEKLQWNPRIDELPFIDYRYVILRYLRVAKAKRHLSKRAGRETAPPTGATRSRIEYGRRCIQGSRCASRRRPSAFQAP